MKKKIRMADIAEQLNVSIVSVSKALSGKSGVSDEMREKILRLADEMGYVASHTKITAENKKNTMSNLGILVADRFFSDSTFYANLYRQIVTKCNEIGSSTLLEIVPWEAEQNCRIPIFIQEKKIDALVIMGEVQRKYLSMIGQCGLPYILLDFYDDDAKDTCSITSDNVSGGYQLTKYLLETGREDIGFLGSIHATSSIMDRFLGYTKALLKAHKTVRMDWVIDDRNEEGAFLPICLPQPMPQAFICSCDEVAYNLVEHLKKNGYKVPKDVAVAGYDDFRYAVLCDPHLTTYHVNTEEMGAAVVKRMVSLVNGQQMEKNNIIIKGWFVERDST